MARFFLFFLFFSGSIFWGGPCHSFYLIDRDLRAVRWEMEEHGSPMEVVESGYGLEMAMVHVGYLVVRG